MPDFVQSVLFVGFVGLMLLLRVDAGRFGAAEWDDEEGDARVFLTRITWYLAGLALALVVFVLHPQPVSQLNLVLAANRSEALALGLIYAVGGSVAVFGLAILTSGRLRFPRPGRYPGAVISSVGTAFFDEFLFRGVLLGLLLGLGLPDWPSVAIAAVIYVGAIRAGTPGSGLVLLLVTLGIGVAGGALVLLTSGLGAGLLGHAATRFALFMAMGVPMPRTSAGPLPGDAQVLAAGPRPWQVPGEGDDGGEGIGPIRPA